jgi:hypothetical protein
MEDDKVAMFDLSIADNQVVVVEEKHYKLLPAETIDREAIVSYR